jgi:hypothetical protein
MCEDTRRELDDDEIEAPDEGHAQQQEVSEGQTGRGGMCVLVVSLDEGGRSHSINLGSRRGVSNRGVRF